MEHNRTPSSSSTDPDKTVLSLFRRHCAHFDIKDRQKIRRLVTVLEFSSQTFAQKPKSRAEAGADPKIWTDLRKLWRDLSRTQFSYSFWDNDDDSGDDGDGADGSGNLKNSKKKEHRVEEADRDASLRGLCAALAKFTRNIVAGVPENQLRAFENEPEIRRLLHYYTSWSAMEDNESVIAARLLTQALSNTVTANDELVEKLWESYMNLPEDEVVLIRLMGSPDAKTLLTTLIFILNCIHQSKKRTQLMVTSSVGIRICIRLLDNMVKLHEAEEGSEGAKAFDIGYAIITQFIETGLVPNLDRKFSVKSEIITPHQTTLLKLIDSYLQSTSVNPTAEQVPDIFRTHESLGSFLAKRFFTLSDYAQRGIHKSLGMHPAPRPPPKDPPHEDTFTSRTSSDTMLSSSSETSSSGGGGMSTPSRGRSNSNLNPKERTKSPAPLQQLDVMLPLVCEALVLVTQCIVTICLAAEEQQERVTRGISTFDGFTNMKIYFAKITYEDTGIVESLIDVLSLLDIFLPRINFGKPVNHDGTPAFSLSASNVDESRNGSGSGPSPTVAPGETSGSEASAGFSYLKRDLVRLLGVLCHDAKDVQDRTRQAGGLPVVMNLCVVDERNPYLREHAIFTLRNLLKDNPVNQKFVDDVKPSKEWDVDGTLKTRVGATTLK